jgi:hypothetical protein
MNAPTIPRDPVAATPTAAERPCSVSPGIDQNTACAAVMHMKVTVYATPTYPELPHLRVAQRFRESVIFGGTECSDVIRQSPLDRDSLFHGQPSGFGWLVRKAEQHHCAERDGRRSLDQEQPLPSS